ncbi:MAG: hypothetical protein VXW41_05980 [SAR324 cluster bacterium]|nr:hypothetical protein [SAR324 cluster bacterium]
MQKGEGTGLPRVVPRLPLSARGRAPDLWEGGCGGAYVGIPGFVGWVFWVRWVGVSSGCVGWVLDPLLGGLGAMGDC